MESESSESESKDVTTSRSDKPIKIAFLGDMYLGGEFIPYVEKHRIDILMPFSRLINDLSDTDILFVNFEGPISRGLNKREDVTALLSNHHRIVEFLTNFKICVLNLANNHIMDSGYEGLENTLRILDDNRLHHIGAGCNDSEADKELIIDCKGKRVAFIAYTTDEIHVRSIIARNDMPGCASYLDVEKVVRRIQDLKNKADVICVSLHWGHEFYQYPSPLQVTIAHALADAGANYIVGHHPHVIQGIEIYNKALIMYSLGNFFFPPFRSTSGRLQYLKPLAREFMIVRSDFTKIEQKEYDLLGGTVNQDYTIASFVGDNRNKFLQKAASLSKPVSNLNYDKFWESYKSRREHELLRENFYEAFRKLSQMPLRDLLMTIKPKDIKRNIDRLFKVVFSGRAQV